MEKDNSNAKSWPDNPISAQFFDFGVDTLNAKVMDFYSSPEVLDRLGKHEDSLKNKFSKLFAAAIIIDVFMLIVYCNPDTDFFIYKDTSIKIRGFTESAAIISGLLYWTSIINFMNFLSYSIMISKITQDIKENNGLSSNFTSYVFSERDFSLNIMNNPASLNDKSKLQKLVSNFVLSSNNIIIMAFPIFHMIIAILNYTNLLDEKTFGTTASVAIVGIAALMNLSALTYFAYGCHMKFNYKLRLDQS